MANTTFKGPVRSQNGFQELVDGVWTPVGGGGGGGGGLAAVENWGATITLPAPSEIGQVYNIVIKYDTDGLNLTTIEAPAMPGTEGSLLVLQLIEVTSEDTISASLLLDISDTNFAPGGAAAFASVQITYAGTWQFLGSDYAIFQGTINAGYNFG